MGNLSQRYAVTNHATKVLNRTELAQSVRVGEAGDYRANATKTPRLGVNVGSSPQR